MDKRCLALLINGVAAAGKDLFIDTLAKMDNYHVIKTSIINPTKLIAECAGWQGTKENRDRKFLADLNTLLDNYNGYPFMKTIDFIEQQLSDILYTSMLDKNPLDGKTSMDPDKTILICVVAREPKHLAGYKAYFDDCGIPVKSILVRREEAEARIPDNHADESVFDFNYNVHLWNVGTRSDFTETILRMDLSRASVPSRDMASGPITIEKDCMMHEDSCIPRPGIKGMDIK